MAMAALFTVIPITNIDFDRAWSSMSFFPLDCPKKTRGSSQPVFHRKFHHFRLCPTIFVFFSFSQHPIITVSCLAGALFGQSFWHPTTDGALSIPFDFPHSILFTVHSIIPRQWLEFWYFLISPHRATQHRTAPYRLTTTKVHGYGLINRHRMKHQAKSWTIFTKQKRFRKCHFSHNTSPIVCSWISGWSMCFCSASMRQLSQMQPTNWFIAHCLSSDLYDFESKSNGTRDESTPRRKDVCSCLNINWW